MSILVEGMKMPQSCPCKLVGVGYDLYCSFTSGVPSRMREYGECCEKETRPDWCPLVEVPPHGDLIDRDTIDYYEVERNGEKHYMVWKPHIDGMPTIIESEE